MSDDRSSRLRERRNKTRDRAANTSNEESDEESSKPNETSEADKQSKSEENNEQSVKAEQVGTYMYLPQSQKREIERTYGLLKADYEYEFGEDFEKNRHFFPLLIQHGLDGLEGLDASEVRELLNDL
ncbi:hypothetical protein SAMN04487948_1132 [Halogranum amylolyticum]|uniref:DUF8160 domain-containing protein n=1 Tax=Halogranum amylolyticum TaxID=660520 RepID=A0A1H8UWY5_9EURY|nr:hypothetical protein [Halogranum amylolyticum]SEP07464.1 hypothetical protein SAMN04487948_1132 [Halogranum amylolyticum]